MKARLTSRHLAALTLVLGMLAGPSCRREPVTSTSAPGSLPVFVSIPPQKYFVERIGDGHVHVSVLLEPGQSPHTYEPTAKQMVQLGAARLYFSVGMPFEKQLTEKISATAPHLTIVDTSRGIQRHEWEAPAETSAHTGHHDTAAHDGHDREHHHLGDEHSWDTHTWVSPRLAIVHARNICEALSRADPEHRATYEHNFKKLQADLEQLDHRIAQALAPLKGKAFYVYHPAFGYFADAYGLKQVAIEMSGKQPSAKYLADLIERAKASGVRLIFVQPQFSRQGAEAVARAIGGAVVPLDPLAEDYINNLTNVADILQQALQTQPATAPAAGTPHTNRQENPA